MFALSPAVSPTSPGGLRNDETSAAVKTCSVSKIITGDALSTMLTCSCWLSAAKSFICFLPAGFDSAVLCTDCMENGNNYSKDPDYLAHGFGPAAGMEYQQQLIPPPYSYCYPGEQHDTGSHTTPLCNGTPSRIRKNSEGSVFPKNHNTTLNQHDRKGMVISVVSLTVLIQPYPINPLLFLKLHTALLE